MKICLAFFLLLTLQAFSQTEDEKALKVLTQLLSKTVFGNKDSMQLERLFAKNLTYGHSRGKVENRSEAIRGIIHNHSIYKDTVLTNMQVSITNKTAIVRHLFSAKEVKQDGTIVQLNFAMMLVWIKQKKHWRLLARQAVALPV